MSRGRKLLIVGLVLAAGLGMAWPFRKTVPEKNYDSVAQTVPELAPQEPAIMTMPQQPVTRRPQLGATAPHVAAKMASMTESQRSTSNHSMTETFDLANHPALSNATLPRSESPVTPAVPPPPQQQVQQPVRTESQQAYTPPGHQQARPAYAIVTESHISDTAAQQRPEVRHVVQNSDTLEKLAKRYLGDEGRALEIFDLNRDLLDNPHLLPIDAELRIPADAQLTLE